MNYNYLIQQNTNEWITAKLGKFSASSASDLLMDTKCEGYKKLIKRIVEERITGKPSESKWIGNKYTDRGHDLEPVAISDFESRTFRKVKLVGLVELNDWCVCSPDGLVGGDTVIQVKNPIFSTQLDYLDDQKIPGDYYKQMQFELYVCGREKNIFYSYHPSLPVVMIETQRDEIMINRIKEALSIAIDTAKTRIKRISA
ncbi:MAG: lambda exonuclease family protein [Candidatus Omnitrophota bacterium]